MRKLTNTIVKAITAFCLCMPFTGMNVVLAEETTETTNAISKSKTAKWLKEGETAEVTLSLPAESYKKVIDVVFVVDNAYGKDNKDATTKASEILDQLEKSATNFAAVNVGLIVSGGYDAVLNDNNTDNSDANTMIDISNLSLFNMVDANNADKLAQLKTDIVDEKWKNMEGRKGSNIQAGLEAARQLLATETEASADDKYIVLISDGGTFSWYENGAVYSKAYNDTTTTANYHYCNPNDFAQIYDEKSEAYSLDFNALMQKDEATVDAYSISKPADSDWPAKNSKNSQYAGYYSANEVTESLRNQAADLTQESVRSGYITSREAALYHAAKTIQAINTNHEANVIFVSLPYNPGSAALFNATESFKQWLADNNYVSLYRMNGVDTESEKNTYTDTKYANDVKDASDVFTSINNELVYLIDAGSTVVDTIGSNFVLSDINSFKMTENGKELTPTVSGNTVNFGETKEDGSYPYSVVYDASTNSFTWNINEKVSKAGGVQLTYQIKLKNLSDKSGTYTVDTNESAILNAKDTKGNKSSEEFEKPKLDYTVYTVTYTDGVDGSDIFADQSTVVLKGENTPSYNGTPTREGYTFIGWSPEVSDTVTGDVIYVAQWKKNADPTPTSTPTPSSKPTAPSTPSASVTPSSASAPVSKSSTKYTPVNTGDESNIAGMIGITGIALICGICLMIARKKHA